MDFTILYHHDSLSSFNRWCFFVLTNRSVGSRLPRNGSIGTHVHRGSTRMVREIQHLFESPTKPRVKLDLIDTIQLFWDVLGFWVQMLHHPESKMPEMCRFFHEKKNTCKFFRWHWVFPSPNQQSADLPIGGCRLCSHGVALSPQLLSLLRKGLVPADYRRVDVQLKLRINDLLVCLLSPWIAITTSMTCNSITNCLYDFFGSLVVG